MHNTSQINILLRFSSLILAVLLSACNDEPVAVEPEITIIENGWEIIQQEIDAKGSGGVINLNPNAVYVVDSTIDLRDYSGIRINGNGATIQRADSEKTSTRLTQDFTGSLDIHVEHVPDNYKVGDRLAIALGISINDVTITPRTITAIDGNKISLDGYFVGKFIAGDTVFKTFRLINGLKSSVVGNSNPGTIIENIFFDGNARNNNINHGWLINGCISLQGGKTSEIRFNHFYDMSTETIIGHGVKVHHNQFDGLNGSAFHTSVHDRTKDINGLSSFSNNTVLDVNRIDKYINGHSEGAVTFSWGAGNLTIKDNYFYSESGNYGVMGIFAGAAENTDENLTVIGNEAYNFEYIIRIISPVENPTKNILITDNLFSNSGNNNFTHLAGDTSIRLGCNTADGSTTILIHESNSACN